MYKLTQVELSKKWKDRWESFVDTIPYVTPLMSWEWFKFDKSINSNAYAYALFKDNSIVAIIKYVHIKAKRGPFLILRHGPIVNWRTIEEKDLHKIIETLKTLGQQHKAWAVRFQPYWPLNDAQILTKYERNLFLNGTNHEVDAERTVQIDLTQSKSDLFKNFRKSTRYCIKQTEKFGIKVIVDNTMKYWNNFQDIFLDTVKRHKWKAQSIKYIKKQYEMFSKVGMSKMFLAIQDGKPIATSIFTFYKDMVIYHHSGSLTKYNKMCASHLLQWELIQYAKEHGYRTYDMWGTAPKENKNHPWYGLSTFKWGFGGQEVRFEHAKDIVLSPLWYLTRLYEKIESKHWQ